MMTEPLLEKIASRIITPDKAMAMFDALFFDSPDAIIIVNAAENAKIVLVNKQAVLLSGYPPGELIGESVRKLVPEDKAASHDSNIKGYGADPRFRSMGENLDLRLKPKRGEDIPVHITLSPVMMEEGLWVILHIRRKVT